MNHFCREIRIPISWGSLAGKLWIPKTPPTDDQKSRTLALHGWHDNAASFDPLIQYFPSDMTLLALDLPGHGFSDHYNEKVAYQWTGFVSDVLEVLSYLSWNRPILIAHSFGGMLATVVAATLQNDIGLLILIESMYSNNDEVTDKMFSDYTQHKYEKDTQQFLRIKIYPSKIDIAKSILRRNSDLVSLSSAEILAARGCKKVHGGFVLTKDKRIDAVTLSYIRGTYWTFMFQTFYDRLTMPLLFINGNKSWFPFEQWMKRDRVKFKPTDHIFVLEGGHMVHMTSPGQVGKIMKDFITQRFTSKL